MSDFTLDTAPPAQDMVELGFTDNRPGYWYYVENLWNEITFNITINKQTLEYETLVVDEFIGQPLLYMDLPLGKNLAATIDRTVERMNARGVLIKHNHERYTNGKRHHQSPSSLHPAP